MNNVIKLRPAGAGVTQPRVDELLEEVRELLDATSYALRQREGKDVGLCDATCVDRIKQLLRDICDSNDQPRIDRALQALSLVELAKLAIDAGEEAFDGRCIEYGLAIAEGLEAALDRLADPEGDPDPGELEARTA
jgi:hypothetical protein